MSNADKKIAELERELQGVTEMLAQVLVVVGEPVVVTKESMVLGLGNKQIAIDDSHELEAFVFSIIEPVVV